MFGDLLLLLGVELRLLRVVPAVGLGLLEGQLDGLLGELLVELLGLLLGLALGVIPGSALEVLRFAPLGDPMQVKVSGSYISIRKAEAEIILVETQ